VVTAPTGITLGIEIALRHLPKHPRVMSHFIGELLDETEDGRKKHNFLI
jgi:hypothetical protein